MKKSKYDCPICGQYMDFIAIGNRNTPYIDGQTYPKMCFGCFHAPQDEIQTYNKDGSIADIEGPFYDHKHIKTPEQLFKDGSVDTIEEAKRCIRGVNRKIKEAGVRQLNKLRLKRPKAEYEFNPDHDNVGPKTKRKRTRRKSA